MYFVVEKNAAELRRQKVGHNKLTSEGKTVRAIDREAETKEEVFFFRVPRAAKHAKARDFPVMVPSRNRLDECESRKHAGASL